MCFFNDNRLNSVYLRFDYSFTQNEGLTEEQVHSKSLTVARNIKSTSPFKVDWQVLSCDPFLSSLRSFLKNQVRMSDDADFKALTGTMVSSSEETCHLMCKLTSLSAHRELALSMIKLEINPEFAPFIEEAECVNALDGETIDLQPGESFECLFKLKVKKLDADALRKINYLFGEDQDPFEGRQERGDTQVHDRVVQVPTYSQLSSTNVFAKWKQFYTLHEMSLFSELHFVWKCKAQSAEEVSCCVGSPPLFIVESPIRIRIRNEREIDSVVQYQAFTVEYEITNLTTRCIQAVLQFDSGPHESKPNFLVAGEMKSLLYLMADFSRDKDEGSDLSDCEDNGGYIVRYTLFPQTLGRLDLPKLSLSVVQEKNKPESHVPLIREFTKKIYVASS